MKGIHRWSMQVGTSRKCGASSSLCRAGHWSNFACVPWGTSLPTDPPSYLQLLVAGGPALWQTAIVPQYCGQVDPHVWWRVSSSSFIFRCLIWSITFRWQEEVPSILRSDKNSWAEEDTDGDSTQQPMTIQKRVIQSGLDSIKGASATSIIELFVEDLRCLRFVIICTCSHN